MSWTQSNMSKYSESNHTFPRTYGSRLRRSDFEEQFTIGAEFLLVALIAAILISVWVLK